jgi:hypothetical protein
MSRTRTNLPKIRKYTSSAADTYNISIFEIPANSWDGGPRKHSGSWVFPTDETGHAIGKKIRIRMKITKGHQSVQACGPSWAELRGEVLLCTAHRVHSSCYTLGVGNTTIVDKPVHWLSYLLRMLFHGISYPK